MFHDRREPDSIKRLMSSWSTETTLPFGDFMFEGNGPDGLMLIGVERKTISDLVGSIQSGRLSGHQLPGMVKEYDFSYLLVEGKWSVDRVTGNIRLPRPKGEKSWKERGMSLNAVWNYLHSVGALCGIHVIQTQGRDETVQRLIALSNWWAKEWDDHKSMDALGAVKKVAIVDTYGQKLSLASMMAAQLPGVGATKARSVADKFLTVNAMASASVESWMEIDGIGKMMAARIYNAFRGME